MKNLRSTLVLMAGLPGAGKTTLAYALGRELGWQVIDKDTYREVLLKQGLNEDHASNVAYELSFAMTRNVLARQQMSVILDTAALDHFVLDEVRKIVGCVDLARLKVILCIADRDLRNYRLRNRLDQSTSIRVDPATISDYLQYFDHLPENKLVLFTNAPLKECLAGAKAYVTS